MRSHHLLAITALLAVTAVVRAQQPVAPAGPTLVKAARLLDVRAGAYRMNQGIWIDAGRLRQVGAFDELRAAAPKEIVVLDLGRATLLPGLIDAHAHLLDAKD